MKKYNKKNVPREVLRTLHEKYGLDPLTASVFARRGITRGNDIMYYLEDDLRFLHEPFLFRNMEDAVERIQRAAEEGEKVLIFGDRDVDGISSTAILYGALKDMGIDVRWRIPVNDEAYGLTVAAVDDFAKDYGSLIVTVDCGISNAREISHAAELGIDVIVTDHHNPPDEIPQAAAILDPKLEDSGYPFRDISGAAVAYKLVTALRFSRSGLYNQDLCLLAVRREDGADVIDCVKVRNLVRTAELSLRLDGPVSVSDTRLPEFLRGQQILVWDAPAVRRKLEDIFGRGVEFNVQDLRPQIAAELPSLSGKELSEIKNLSKIARYSGEAATEIGGFYNLFVTLAEKKAFPKDGAESYKNLELVAVAALADIMPMRDENRIFVRTALAAVNGGKIRAGLAELLSKLDMTGKQISSTDLTWKLIPALNSAGRLGQSDLALRLLLSDDPAERGSLADKILALNGQRRAFVSEAEMICTGPAGESLGRYGQKLCVAADRRINRGITGILAAHLMQKFGVPAVAVSLPADGGVAVGSMRSCRGCNATAFLDGFGDILLSHGGHDCAAGFSLAAENLDRFLKKIGELSESISLLDEDGAEEVDAELPAEYITPRLLELADRFEPFGEDNRELVFLSNALRIQDAVIVGKAARQHLKLVFDCGKYKFPAIYWGAAERLNRDFKAGDRINILYNIGRNTFNGAVTPQMIILDADTAE